MLSKYLAATLFALGTSGLLVVPEAKDIAHSKSGHRMNLRLQCHECPFPSVTESSGITLNDEWDSWLSLNVTTKGNVLSVNDHPIFPVPREPVQLEAILVRQSDMMTSQPVPVSYGLEFQPVKIPNSNTNMMVFHFTVLNLAGFPVPVSTVYLPTVVSPNGDLLLLKDKADVLPMPMKSLRQCRRNRKCLKHLIIARIRAFILAAKHRALNIAKTLSFKGCHHKGPKTSHLHHESPSHENMQQDGNSHVHHHHKSMKFANRFCHILKTIVLPGVIGLVAGIILLIFSLQLACGIVAVRAFYRQRREQRVSDQERGDDVEKEALMDDEQPPQYNEADYGKITLPAEKE
ncbi:hypothetical protein LOZ57_004886 [Ophidiomyces ophidiicola]|uniref:uncharacterized protein n=1 Tax=Ophidiomyces ophidiicola TaxID=1387563 RepID=UPI0020C5AE8B|nr:uncharacterized protein LOZ57_004886 [Ophidiomyces ophidiicola]KAI1944210.1 hypothetical protein LOZ57_004886 [Ophidiomyces ophidiicola]KAI2049185.1 hypothetical protein LOZ43_005172 [Ophidiomyces ophidiicola]